MGKVVVLGSINQDIVATVESHPIQGETVRGRSLRYIPGGKGANQAIASASAGARTHLIGAVGNDGFGSSLLRFLKEKDVITDRIRVNTEQSTGLALVAVDQLGENRVIIIPGANGLASDDTTLDLYQDDVLVSVFEVPVTAIVEFFRRGRAVGCTTILNPAPAAVLQPELAELVDLMVVNAVELAMLAGRDVSPDSSIETLTNTARSISPTTLVTRGARGALLLDDAEVFEVPGRKVDVVDTTGAGDCLVGSMAARLAQGDGLSSALDYANTAASISVTRQGAGTSMPSTADVLAQLA